MTVRTLSVAICSLVLAAGAFGQTGTRRSNMPVRSKDTNPSPVIRSEKNINDSLHKAYIAFKRQLSPKYTSAGLAHRPIAIFDSALLNSYRRRITSFISDSLARRFQGSGVDSMLSANIKQAAKQATDDLVKGFTVNEWLRKENAFTKVRDSLRTVANLAGAVKKIAENPVKIKNAYAAYRGQILPGYADTSYSQFVNDVRMGADMLVINIPVTIHYQFLDYTPGAGPAMNNFSFHYDRNNYISELSARLKTKLRPDQLIPANEDILALAGKQAETIVQNQFNELQQKYHGLLDAKIKSLGDPKAILSKNAKLIESQLLSSDYIKSIREKKLLFEQLRQQANNNEAVDQRSLELLSMELEEYKGTVELVNKLVAEKEKWQKSALFKQLKQLEALRKSGIDQLMKDPASIRKMADQYLNLNGIQKFFLKINKLNIGQNTVSLSPLSVMNYLNKGVNTEFANGNKYFFAVVGKKNDFTSPNDVAFSENIFNSGSVLKGIRMGTGTLGSANAHISFMSYQDRSSNNGNWNQPNAGKNTMVVTLSNRVNVGEHGFIATEISKSSMQYENVRNPMDTIRRDKPVINKLLSADNFSKSMAFSVKYENEYPDLGFSHRITAGSIANGYYNPGNSYLASGSKELGIDLRKTLFKKKAVFSVRNNIREYKYSDATGNKWRNSYWVLDGRWQIGRGQYIGFRYQPMRSVKIDDKTKQVLNATDRFSLDGNFSKRINRKIYYRNYLSVAYQDNSYEYVTGQRYSAKSMLFNSFQNLALRKYVLYWNTSYNHVSNNNDTYFYFNTSLVSDVGMTYSFLKGISFSSAISYNSIKGWYRQVGIKQTISGQLGKKLIMNVYVDARQNLVTWRPIYQDRVRADWSIQYLFK